MKAKTLLPVLFALVLGVMLPSQIVRADEKKEPTLEETYSWLTDKIAAFGGKRFVDGRLDWTISYRVLRAEGSTFVFESVSECVDNNQ